MQKQEKISYGDVSSNEVQSEGDMSSQQVQLEPHPIIRVIELATQEFHLKQVTIE